MNDVRTLPMTIALLVAATVFARIMWGKFQLLWLASGRDDMDAYLGRVISQLPRRGWNVLVYFLGQKKFFKPQERSTGLMHAFIFWGFLVLQIRTLYLISISFVPDLHLPFHNQYALLKDITELVVFVMVAYAMYRRVFVKPARLTLSLEAIAVLGMIMGLVVSDFCFDASLFAYAIATDTMTPLLAAEMDYAVIGAGLANALVDLEPETLLQIREVSYWTHIWVVLTFLNMLPGSKHFHVITSVLNVFLSEIALVPHGRIRAIDDIEEQEHFGVSHVLQFDPNQLLDTYTCTECGRCEVNCPTSLTGKPLNPKLLIVDIRNQLYRREAELIANSGPSADYDGPTLDESVGYDQIWDCTTCRACSEACPVMIEHVDKIIDLRRNLTLMEARFPKELGATFKNLEQKGNPWGLPMADRTAWTEGLDIPMLADSPDAEYIFWVGCAGAYDDQQKKVSRALVEILRAAKISFAILGEEETCTGDAARRAGNEYLFQIMAQQNIETLKAYGGHKKKLVTHCPHCFNTLANEYPHFGGTFEVVHHSTLIERLITEGRVTPRSTPEGVSQVTYHDSCYLGRYNDVYEQPRRALGSIPGIEVKEMTRNRAAGMCCGAGGARVWMEEHNGSRINQARVEQAMEVQPDTIAVACPFCKMMLKDGVNELQLEGVQTKDIAELVAESLT
jgi:Fe-S oxidoreductase